MSCSAVWHHRSYLAGRPRSAPRIRTYVSLGVVKRIRTLYIGRPNRTIRGSDFLLQYLAHIRRQVFTEDVETHAVAIARSEAAGRTAASAVCWTSAGHRWVCRLNRQWISRSAEGLRLHQSNHTAMLLRTYVRTYTSVIIEHFERVGTHRPAVHDHSYVRT